VDAIEVRYAGVLVGRSGAVRDLDDRGAFVTFSEPLPVGTIVTLKLGDNTIKEARVDEVIESADAAAAGMRVRFVSGAASESGRVRAAVTTGIDSSSARIGDGKPQVVVEEASEAVSAGVPTDGVAADAGQGGGGRRRRKRR
jgi:hypothetical protein